MPAGKPAFQFGTPGATAVWAPENTREAIFEAIKRKETYGTSGPLMRLRFFGGWEYPMDLVKDEKFVEKAYKGGVPMGGDLPKMNDQGQGANLCRLDHEGPGEWQPGSHTDH